MNLGTAPAASPRGAPCDGPAVEAVGRFAGSQYRSGTMVWGHDGFGVEENGWGWRVLPPDTGLGAAHPQPCPHTIVSLRYVRGCLGVVHFGAHPPARLQACGSPATAAPRPLRTAARTAGCGTAPSSCVAVRCRQEAVRACLEGSVPAGVQGFRVQGCRGAGSGFAAATRCRSWLSRSCPEAAQKLPRSCLEAVQKLPRSRLWYSSIELCCTRLVCA
jgi:hypothetical protein